MINGFLSYWSLISENYVEIIDLFGGIGFEDYDRFYVGLILFFV